MILHGTGPTSDNREILPARGDVQIRPDHSKPPDSETLPGYSDLHPRTYYTAGTLNDSHFPESPHIPPESHHQPLASHLSVPSLPQPKPLTIYTSHQNSLLDSAPSSSRRPGDGMVTRRYRKREHIYVKVVSLYS